MMYNWVIDNGTGSTFGPDRLKEPAHTFDHNVYKVPCRRGDSPVWEQAVQGHGNLAHAHQQSLAQCRQWLNSHLSGVNYMPVSSNAEAARLASLDSSRAAIAGLVAAELYDLTV